MTIVTITFDSIIFNCGVKLNQEDNIDQGFEIENVILRDYPIFKNFQHILDQEQLTKLIFEQLKSL